MVDLCEVKKTHSSLVWKLPACNSRTWEAEAGGSLQVPCRPRLHNEFKASLKDISRPCLKEKEKKRHIVNSSEWNYEAAKQ